MLFEARCGVESRKALFLPARRRHAFGSVLALATVSDCVVRCGLRARETKGKVTKKLESCSFFFFTPTDLPQTNRLSNCGRLDSAP